MKKLSIINIICIVSLLFACSSSHKDKVLKTIKESSVSESSIMYHNDLWYNFRNQDEEVKEKYLVYLDEIVDYIQNLELTEIKEDSFKGKTTFDIKVEKDDHKYLLHLTYKWPNTNYLKLSIDNKDKYYKLKDGDGVELTNIYAFSENAPFNNIHLYEYQENERRNK
ncbi:MAG: hypothetical protein IJH31_02080 [Erysipelotrichaceae bacterium]|nr:hypothetical protein [Erysipelotrichaceae bacterium]